MTNCDIGMITCLVSDPNIKYELLSFFALMLLPLAITIRMAINEIIFQRWKERFKARFQRQQEQINKMEVWLRVLVSERAEGLKRNR